MQVEVFSTIKRASVPVTGASVPLTGLFQLFNCWFRAWRLNCPGFGVSLRIWDPRSRKGFPRICLPKFGLAMETAIHRMRSRPGLEREWKMALGLEWPKNGHGYREKWENPILGSILPSRRRFFRPYQACGHFLFSFPYPLDVCTGPLSHSVTGHFHP